MRLNGRKKRIMIFECDTEERYLDSAGEITGICVSRPVNGITLNGLE